MRNALAWIGRHPVLFFIGWVVAVLAVVQLIITGVSP